MFHCRRVPEQAKNTGIIWDNHQNGIQYWTSGLFYSQVDQLFVSYAAIGILIFMRPVQPSWFGSVFDVLCVLSQPWRIHTSTEMPFPMVEILPFHLAIPPFTLGISPAVHDEPADRDSIPHGDGSIHLFHTLGEEDP